MDWLKFEVKDYAEFVVVISGMAFMAITGILASRKTRKRQVYITKIVGMFLIVGTMILDLLNLITLAPPYSQWLLYGIAILTISLLEGAIVDL